MKLDKIKLPRTTSSENTSLSRVFALGRDTRARAL